MKKTESGMHEIKNKRRPRAVKNKKEGLHLRAKRRMSRTSKAIVTLCTAAVLMIGVYGVGSAFFKDTERNTVDLNYGSPSIPVEEGELYSLTSGYTPVDVFARLNWKFSQQTLWYGEMHGTVDTVIQQSVSTYKQYDHGTLISADLTESSLIKGASQFCYLKDKDRVIWRKPASKNYDGLNTVWQTGAPYNIMTIGGENGFKATNGLPAYELSVYVIAEDTVASTSPVTQTEDGRFQITYELKPETWQEEVNGVLTTKGATAYYINQMIFTGGLTTPPEFNAISVTFTFDENWQVFQTDIEEKYSAKYGPIAAPCVSTSTTKYEYNTEKAHSNAYEEYFYQYAEGEVTNAPVVKEITALDCLAEGFGSVLTEPTVLDLDLTVNDAPYHGTVDLDLSQTDFAAFDPAKLTAKAKLGALSLWVEEGNAYLNYGGLKLSLKLDELISLVTDLTAKEPAALAEEEGDEDLLTALAGGEFTLADGKAELHSVLPLLGLELPVDFYFNVGEDAITVEKVTANVSLGDSLSIGAQLGFGKEHLPALSASQKMEYAPLMPYVNELVDLFTADVLHADIAYNGDGISVSGGLDLRLKELALAGNVNLDLNLSGIELSKTVGLSYTEGALYLDLDGIKVQATLEEGIALLKEYVSLPELSGGDVLSGLDLGALVNTLLSDEFAALFSSKEENGLRLAIKGSELLSAFGVDFALGDVTLKVGEGSLSASALGAEIGLKQGTDVALDTEGYTPVLPYAQTLIQLFSNENLSISLSFASGEFQAAGNILLNLSSQKAAGDITLGYGGAEKTISIIYEGNTVYLGVEGIRVKANVNEAVALVSSLVGAESDVNANAIINKVLSLNFGSVLSLGEENDALNVVIKGTELLNALGIEFALGDVEVELTKAGVLTAKAFGATVTIEAGEPFEAEIAGYINIVEYANVIAEIIKGGYLKAGVSYEAEKLKVEGTISLGLSPLQVEGTFTFTYGTASQEIGVIYGGETVYLEIGGMKISANINEAVGLVEKFIELPTIDTEANDLIEKVLNLNFADVLKLTEEGDTLSLAIAGTELLDALGINFDLGSVDVTLTKAGVLTAKAFGATVTVEAGDEFTAETDGYINIVEYVNVIAEIIKGGYLSAHVIYTTENGKLSVEGNISLGLSPLQVEGTFTITYGTASQEIGVIYGGETVYLTLGGMKISANINEAVGLVVSFMGKDEGTETLNNEETDLIEKVLNLNFADVLKLTEEGDTLSLAIAGTELLNALGINFDLGSVDVMLTKAGVLTAKAFGATVTIEAGEPFEAEIAGYIDIVEYANIIAEMIKSGYLSAHVSYTTENGKLSVEGDISLGLKPLQVEGTFTLTYGTARQEIGVIYGENVVYLTLGGMKISANINEAVGLVEKFIELPAIDTEANDLIETILSLDFAKVLKLTEEGDTLSLAIAGTELLDALGINFDLGSVDVTLTKAGVLTAKAFGATVTIEAGEPFETTTDGYIEIVDYANMIAEIIKGGYLSAHVSYATEDGKLSVDGNISLGLKPLQVEGTFTLTYGTASQEIGIIYGGDTVYLTLGGMKVSANINEAIELVEQFVELPASETEATDLIEKVLSLDFADVLKFTEEGDTLSLAIAGTELLDALGIEFALGDVEVELTKAGVITATAFGATIEIKQGDEFTAETDDYIEIVDYANMIAEIIKGGYLSAHVSYETDKLSVEGNISLGLKPFVAQGTFTLTYGAAKQPIGIIYGENVVYLTLGGMKVSANINEALKLVEKFVELPATETEAADLIEKVLSLDFAEVLKLTEEGDTLSLAIAGTELLKTFGLEFELGSVEVELTKAGVLTAKAFGATVTVEAGEEFTADTTDYIEIVDYANMIAEIIKGGYLKAGVSYETEKLKVEGTISLGLKPFVAQGTFTLTYGTASQEIGIIYGENVVYLTLGGMKVSANINEAIKLVEQFVELPATETEATDLIEKVLSLDFAEVLKLTEEGDTLSLAIAGTDLLKTLGLNFDLGSVEVELTKAGVLTAKAFGAEITVEAGEEFTADTTDYIEIVDYANMIAEIIKGGYLKAGVSYEADKLKVDGTISLGLKPFAAQGTFTLTYGTARQEIGVIYGGDTVYLTLGGMKVSANINEALKLVEKFVELPATETEAADLIEKVLSLDFADVLKLTEEGDTLSLAIAGTDLLKALGLNFDLGSVEVELTKAGVLTAKAFGAEITVEAGEEFTAETAGYIEIVDYANMIAEIIKGGYLNAGVSYTTEDGKLSVDGNISLGLKPFAAQGTFTLTYGAASQEIGIIYGENADGEDVVYLELAGMKVCAKIEEAVALVTSLIGTDEEKGSSDTQTLNEEEMSLIEKLLDLKFSEFLTLTEADNTLSLAIAGTELLEKLGLDFKLGDVKVGLTKDGVITASALGVEITVEAGKSFEAAGTDGYINIADYATAVAGMITGGYLSAEVSYKTGKLSVEGNISLGLKPLQVEGTFTLTYGTARQEIGIIYGKNADGKDVVYLELAGMKVCAKIEDAVSLVISLIGTDGEEGSSDTQTPKEEEKSLIEKILNLKFSDFLTLTEEVGEEKTTLSLAIAGTELLKELGISFELGSVNVGLTKDGVITASALGVEITVGAGEAFTAAGTDGYINIAEYATAVAAMIQGGYLKADVSYETGKLSVVGTLSLGLSPLQVQGTFTLAYDEKELKQIGVVYAGRKLYLTIYGADPANASQAFKVSVGKEEAVGLVTSLMGAENDAQAASLIEKLLKLNFADFLTLTEADNTLSLAIAGTELLNALGIDLKLGGVDVALTKDGKLTATAFGATVTVGACDEFTSEITEGYIDLDDTALFNIVEQILKDKALALNGALTLSIKGAQLDLTIENAVLSFGEEGLKVYAQICLTLQGKLALEATIAYDRKANTLQLDIGSLGVEIAFNELGSLGDALLNVYNKLREVVDNMLTDSSKNPLPELESLNEILGLVSGGGETSSFDWTQLVKTLTIKMGSENSDTQIGVNLSGSLETPKFAFEGSLYVKNAEYKKDADGKVATDKEGKPVLKVPEIHSELLGTKQFKEFIGYLGSAVDLLNATDLTLTFNGKVTSTEDAYKDFDGVKYEIEASMSTHRGNSTLIHLDMDGKNLWADTDVFAHASINIKATNAADNSLFIDLFILDAALGADNTPAKNEKGEAVKDGNLDFYFTLSQFDRVDAENKVTGYDPVRLYAPSSEILTLLSAALPMLGVDVDILNNYMIAKWLSLENVAQLKAFTPFMGKLLGEKAQGTISSVSALLNSLTGKASGLLDELLGGTGEASLSEAQDTQDTQDVQGSEPSIADYLKAFTITGEEGKAGTTTLSITLNSEAIYGIEGLADVQATLIKTQDVENKDGKVTEYGKFQKLDLLNIYNKDGTVNTSLHGAIDYNEVTPFLPEGEYKTFLGAEKLILSLVKSATHVEEQSEGGNTYALNKNFYIDGDINIEALNKNVTVKMAISVDVGEKGDIGITVHIEYGKESFLVDIFRSAGWVDLTIKNGNVYIKRITNPEDESKKEEIYRMMPMENFMADILNQVDFIFNFGSLISDALKEEGDNSGSDGGTGAEVKKDFGTQLDTYLTSYNFTEGGGENGGALWKLVITGSALSNVLSDIDIDLKSSGVGVLRGLSASLTVASILHLNADLRYRNPQDVMDDGITNVADRNVQETLDHAMSQKINDVDWANTTYLEGQLGCVKYNVGGTLISEQRIVYDMITKEFYSKLTYPSFEGAPEPPAGYHWEWKEPTELSPTMEIAAVAVPNTYTVSFTSEYQIEGYEFRDGRYVKTDEYIYNSSYELHIGTRVYGDTYIKELVGFECSEGHIITDLKEWQHLDSENALELTAVWKDVEFTVTFDVNGAITTRKGIFGETITPPEGYEDAKTGYTFTGWDGVVPETFSKDMKFTAQYTPNKYEITFESEYPIEGWAGVDFALQGERYVATYTFTYDSEFKLRLNAQATVGEYVYILTGWQSDKIYKDNLPNVLADTTFTAVWEESGVNVYFGDEAGNIFEIEPRNKQIGSSLTQEDLPDVPKKGRGGYTGEWDIDLDHYVVPERGDGADGKIVIRAKYTPITYVIHQYSLYPLQDYAANGFKRIEGEFDSEGVQGDVYYVRKLLYVYGSNQVTLENGTTIANHAVGVKKEGYDFKGFYTQRFGKGTPIENINDDAIEDAFNWNVGDSDNFYEQNTIFAHWKNNAITVRFYSDIPGTLMDGYDGYGHFHNIVYYDDKTQITYAPTATDGGYQLLGWFAEDPAAPGGWKMVTDVAEYRVDDNAVNNAKKAYDVALYAVWIKTIKLQITEFKQVDIVLGYEYNIHGTVEGGLPYPGKSKEIYEAIKVNKETTGVYVLHGRGNKSDRLRFGNAVEVSPTPDDPNVGTFGNDNMTTSTFGTKFTDQADYGGMVMQMKFTFDGASVTMVDAAVISMKTYTVTYHSQSGAVLRTVDGVHINYTGTYTSSFFDDKFAINGNLSSSAQPYADELAESNGIVCPQTEEEGKTYIWPHREITGNMDIYPVYVTELQDVTFRSDVKLDDRWEEEHQDGKLTGKYIFKTKLYLEATVIYQDNEGELKKDTVQVGENIFDLPASSAIRSIGKRKGTWGKTSFLYDPYGTTFTAEYGEDKITYYSEIDFNLEYEGVTYQLKGDTDYIITYQSTYTLWTPTRDGYTFLGWYTKGTDGKWSKVETLELAENSAETRVEALWATEKSEVFSVTLKTKRTIRRSGITSYESSWRYESTLSIKGDYLLGAIADEGILKRTISVEHYVANDNEEDHLTITNSPKVTEESGKIEYKWDQTWSRNSILGTDYKRSHSYAVVTFTYHLEGLEDITFTVKVNDMDVAD